MAIEPTNIVICPACGAENIEGSDTCQNCLADLRSVDVPMTDQVASESDLLLPIGSIRLTKPHSVALGATVREAIDRMKDDATGAVVVLEDERVAGIFTDRDVLLKIAGDASRFDEPVDRYMTPDPVVLRIDDHMATALNKMGVGGFRHIPVMHGNELVAIVSARDVWAWVLGRYFD